MKRSSVALWTAAVAVVLLAGPAKAAPPEWRYKWTPSTFSIESDDSPDSKIKLTGQNDPQVFGGSDITSSTVTVESNANPGTPDEFASTADVVWNLKITDIESGVNKNFTFTGSFNTQDPLDPSTVAEGQSNVKFTHKTPLSYADQQIGNNLYTITYNGYTPPPPEGADTSGSISYRVRVRPLDIQKAPEPSSMMLAGLGASFLGFGAWRKRRQNAPKTESA
jgi:hypothetical protein